MARLTSIRWLIFIFPRLIRHRIIRNWNEFKLIYNSLTHNHHNDLNYFGEIFLEPIFWFVDNFVGTLGKFFVTMVVLLTFSVVTIAYWLGLPYWWERSQIITIFLLVIGNWLLINIIYHYYKAVVIPPGFPPHTITITEAASICKKCISPKPARSHHCSVCNKCILSMDHHCPWLNNCVGHFNRRHFYLYMVYMVFGVLFLIIGGFDLGYIVLWIGDESGIASHDDPDLIGQPVHVNNTGALIPIVGFPEYDTVILPREHKLPIPKLTIAQKYAADPIKKRAIIYMAFINIAVFFALGSLVIWHGKLVTCGETSVEAHINQAEYKRIGSSYKNPYNFGPKKNWKIFLGLVGNRSFFYHVLLPSGHLPVGNGLIWHSIHNAFEDWP